MLIKKTHTHTNTINWYVSLFIKTHARYMKLPLKIWKWEGLVVVQCCMSVKDILHYFHTNRVSSHSYIELFIQKTSRLNFLGYFMIYQLQESCVMAGWISENYLRMWYDCNNGNNSQNLCTFIIIHCSHSSIHFLHWMWIGTGYLKIVGDQNMQLLS